MDAKLLYRAWNEDKYTEYIANLFVEPETADLLHMDKVYIYNIKKLKKI